MFWPCPKRQMCLGNLPSLLSSCNIYSFNSWHYKWLFSLLILCCPLSALGCPVKGTASPSISYSHISAPDSGWLSFPKLSSREEADTHNNLTVPKCSWLGKKFTVVVGHGSTFQNVTDWELGYGHEQCCASDTTRSEWALSPACLAMGKWEGACTHVLELAVAVAIFTTLLSLLS